MAPPSASRLGPRVAGVSPLLDFARRVRLGWVGASGGGGRNPATGRSIGGASRSPVLGELCASNEMKGPFLASNGRKGPFMTFRRREPAFSKGQLLLQWTVMPARSQLTGSK